MQSMKLHGFRLLNRFGVDVPYGKHDFALFFGNRQIKDVFLKKEI